jgi:hypothetical protein
MKTFIISIFFVKTRNYILMADGGMGLVAGFSTGRDGCMPLAGCDSRDSGSLPVFMRLRKISWNLLKSAPKSR